MKYLSSSSASSIVLSQGNTHRVQNAAKEERVEDGNFRNWKSSSDAKENRSLLLDVINTTRDCKEQFEKSVHSQREIIYSQSSMLANNINSLEDRVGQAHVNQSGTLIAILENQSKILEILTDLTKSSHSTNSRLLSVETGMHSLGDLSAEQSHTLKGFEGKMQLFIESRVKAMTALQETKDAPKRNLSSIKQVSATDLPARQGLAKATPQCSESPRFQPSMKPSSAMPPKHSGENAHSEHLSGCEDSDMSSFLSDVSCIPATPPTSLSLFPELNGTGDSFRDSGLHESESPFSTSAKGLKSTPKLPGSNSNSYQFPPSPAPRSSSFIGRRSPGRISEAKISSYRRKRQQSSPMRTRTTKRTKKSSSSRSSSARVIYSPVVTMAEVMPNSTSYSLTDHLRSLKTTVSTAGTMSTVLTSAVANPSPVNALHDSIYSAVGFNSPCIGKTEDGNHSKLASWEGRRQEQSKRRSQVQPIVRETVLQELTATIRKQCTPGAWVGVRGAPEPIGWKEPSAPRDPTQQ